MGRFTKKGGVSGKTRGQKPPRDFYFGGIGSVKFKETGGWRQETDNRHAEIKNEELRMKKNSFCGCLS